VVIAGGYFLGFPWAATSPDPAQADLAWRYFFSVGILHSIGAALIMLELLVLTSQSARQVVGATGVLAVLAFALAPAADGTLAGGGWHPLLNWISHGGGSPFPLLPWSGNVFAGVVVGWIVLPQGGHTPYRVIWARLAALAVVVGAIAMAAQASPWTLVTATTHPSARPAFVVSNLAAVLVLTLGLSIVTSPTIYMFHLIVLFGFNIQLARRIGETRTLPQALALAAGMIVLTSAYALTWHHVKARRAAHAD
jgi:Heparan-alpha-glucosaminide N-acetyltransferase, catalytic